MDAASVVAAIQQVSIAIVSVGAAVLMLWAIMFTYRSVMASIDAHAGREDIEDADDVSAFYEQGGALVCENCDYELDEDDAINALDSTGHCPKCGHEVAY